MFCKNLEDHYNHPLIVFNEFVNNELIINKKKMELCKEFIELLEKKIRKGKIKLQEYIVKKILDFPNKKKRYQEITSLFRNIKLY